MGAVGRLGQGAGVLAHGVARDPDLAGDLPQGEALNPGVLHRFPERQLPGRQLPGRRKGRFSTAAGRLDGNLFDRLGLQVGQLPQLGLAETVVAQAFHDQVEFGSGGQGPMRGSQHTGSRRGLAAGDDFALIAYVSGGAKVDMVEGMSIREAARTFGLHRDTVRKMLAYSVPPGYRRQVSLRRPKLESFTGVIDRILESDLSVPRKQRHTAKRIFERLRDEYGFGGQYTIVKDYVRERRRRSQEMFVPLSHAPGHAQCDFGEALVVIGGVEQKAHCFVLDLPHSDGCFIKA